MRHICDTLAKFLEFGDMTIRNGKRELSISKPSRILKDALLVKVRFQATGCSVSITILLLSYWSITLFSPLKKEPTIVKVVRLTSV